MISRFTWPNFKEGNDEEGTKVLLKKKKHEKWFKHLAQD